jgi:hypothetical protein
MEKTCTTKPENGTASKAGENALEWGSPQIWARKAWIEVNQSPTDHSCADKTENNLRAFRKAAKPKQPKNGRRDEADHDECEKTAEKKQKEEVGGEEALKATSLPLNNTPSNQRRWQKRRCCQRAQEKVRLSGIRLGRFVVHRRCAASPNICFEPQEVSISPPKSHLRSPLQIRNRRFIK